ncbi:hypothetical protein ScPMuIL_016328 [Solemya velum]
MASPAKKAKTDSTVPMCPYGARCYRKNPAHFKEYNHPPKDGGGGSTSADDVLKHDDIDASKLTPCPFGASCYRKNLLHYAEYSHPTTGGSSTTTKGDDSGNGSGNDTDVVSSDEDDDKKKKDGKNNVLKRGMSLVKNYSKMTEAERKDLIKKAMKAKEQLQKELKVTQDKMKKKEQQVEKLQKEINSGILLVDGEKEALEGKKTTYFSLQAERQFKEGSADQTHFRLAESQFYRLLSGPHAQSYRVTKVEYVVNPECVRNFRERTLIPSPVSMDHVLQAGPGRPEVDEGEDMSYPVLAFHGTNIENIPKICQGGFLVPGETGFKHKTDTGWYGKGVYFSEFPGYSMGYIAGSTKLLLCQVLPGKVYECTKLIHGHALMKGYDSHMSPCKKELIAFNSHHILPSYIVHYTQASTEFNYTVKKDIKDLLESTELTNKFQKASKCKAKTVFTGCSFQFTGTFMDTQANMMKLILNMVAIKEIPSCQSSQKLTPKHSKMLKTVQRQLNKEGLLHNKDLNIFCPIPGTASVFTTLVASPEEYELKTAKVQKAEKGKCDTLKRLGDDWKVDDDLLDGCEEFICAVYGKAKFDSVNEVRHLMHQSKCDGDIV